MSRTVVQPFGHLACPPSGVTARLCEATSTGQFSHCDMSRALSRRAAAHKALLPPSEEDSDSFAPGSGEEETTSGSEEDEVRLQRFSAVRSC